MATKLIANLGHIWGVTGMKEGEFSLKNKKCKSQRKFKCSDKSNNTMLK